MGSRMSDWPPVSLAAFKSTKPRRRHSVIYVVVDRRTDQFKVGHAVNPRIRFMKMLGTYRGRRDLELVACGLVEATVDNFSAGHAVEDRMHAFLRPDRTGHGRDWYKPTAIGFALTLLERYTTPCPPSVVLEAEATCTDPMEVLTREEVTKPHDRLKPNVDRGRPGVAVHGPQRTG